MTPAEFKTKWAKVKAKESAAYQSHFDDLCRMLGLPTPLEADPAGQFFCYQKRAVKDAELFQLNERGEEASAEERGFADVWRKDCFAWEYKTRNKSLDAAYRQLLRYRESLLNPPLLVVCDFDRFIIRTNFNGAVQETYDFTNDTIDRPQSLRTLRAVFQDPNFLKPQRTTAQVTENLAQQIAEVAKSLQKRQAVELADAKTRAEMTFAQRKNLRIARFLNRIIFCFFAQDTGLLPKDLFTNLLKKNSANLPNLTHALQDLFRAMAKGGPFGIDQIRHFNGHLFEHSTVFELTAEEVRRLADAGEADWQFIQPSIMGTLFERALDFEQGGKLRAQLGAHYTSETDIKTLVEPVLMDPLRREWKALKAELAAAYQKGQGTPAQRAKLAALQDKLASLTILDPACGSGNFLYVSLQLLLDLEKEIIAYATQLGFQLTPRVNVQQLRAIEINPYAFELAQVSVQIGFLQWRRDNGFDNDRSPVLQNLDGFHNEDALLVPHFHSKPKNLKEAQAGEHGTDDALKFYTEREWPKCDVIVSNPPFLGDKMMRGELGDHYVDELRRIYGDRIPAQSDLCCYWFEKARALVEDAACARAGLLATQGIRGGANREVLKRIRETGEIFFAESDRPWVLAGANVHVSMVGFDSGKELQRVLDGKPVSSINASLAAGADTATATKLLANTDVCFLGDIKGAAFDISDADALRMLNEPNASGLPNSTVVLPWANGLDVTRRQRHAWIIDFGVYPSLDDCTKYEAPFAHIERTVRPVKSRNRRPIRAKYWWRHSETHPEMRRRIAPLPRFLATVALAKHRLFVWMSLPTLPDHAIFTFARPDDLFFGIMHSRQSAVWALKQGTRLETRPRYTPTTCFETFPLPRPTPAQETAIATAAKELNEPRERWLNPPEWTQTVTLEFPGSAAGPWSRYIDPATVDTKTGIGTVGYPRLEPRDADCAAKLEKRTLTNLYNERPAWLDLAHKKLDAAVAAAYGWPPDLTDDQILEKLLALNLERAAEEAKDAADHKPHPQRPKQAGELV